VYSNESKEKSKDIESHPAYFILSYPLGNQKIEKVVFTRLQLGTSIFYDNIDTIIQQQWNFEFEFNQQFKHLYHFCKIILRAWTNRQYWRISTLVWVSSTLEKAKSSKYKAEMAHSVQVSQILSIQLLPDRPTKSIQNISQKFWTINVTQRISCCKFPPTMWHHYNNMPKNLRYWHQSIYRNLYRHALYAAMVKWG